MNQEKEWPMNELREYQVNVGIHLSHHRLKILEYLTKHRTHPTVDIIYKNLSKEIHTLSKTTIYKHDTIKVFTSKGIVQELTMEEKEVRYDADTTQHAHFHTLL